MTAFRKLIAFLNRIKEFDVWGDKKNLSEEERAYLDKWPKQNPFGLIGLVLGGAAFAFGPQFGWIPVAALVFCILTLFTFDKKTEDNIWPFYLGITLSLIGLYMFIAGEVHQLVL
ncbi:cell division protein FtsK [Bhargavaea ullalensis]|uniref:Cell division protein FtsK n=1 Tax=Bhargavaea ullalensis TaxID=1265685 RepID=A0ABV2GCA9_9BACL